MGETSLAAPFHAQLLAVIDTQGSTRDDVAEAYAEALAYGPSLGLDWPSVNHAIIDRWSLSALEYIKAEAWKIVGDQ